MPALIIEDGTGIPDANSYFDLDFFINLADMYIDTSVYTEIDIVRKILTSHFVFNNKYESLLLGTKYFVDPLSPNFNPNLDFPRTNMFNAEGFLVNPEFIIPLDIKKTIALITLEYLTEPAFDEEVVSFNAVQIPKLVSVTASNTLVNNENAQKEQLKLARAKLMNKYLSDRYNPYIIIRERV